MLFVIPLALAPAFISWWTGRGILARADDPALPEILLERRRRLGTITLAGAVTLAVVDSASLFWTLPLLWIALLVGNYPLRRTLFAERWSLPVFLRYAVSSGIAQAGWRLLVPIGPLVTITCSLGLDPDAGAVARHVALWMGGAFALVTLLWQHFYAQVWLDLHHATPLRAAARPELIARLDGVLDRANLARRPGIFRFGAPGGHFVNALAIPSLHAPAIALSDGLLSALTDDEVVGVFAHEVGHHEQFTRRRLLVSAAAGLVLAVFECALPLCVLTAGSGAATLGTAILAVILVAALGRRRSSRRDRETDSDRRAVRLTGDPASLASALAKVHLYNRVPRRWPHAVERGATHPSLARRIQALGAATAILDAPVATSASPPLALVRSTRGDAVVALDMTRAHWFEGVPPDAALDLNGLRAAASSYRAVAYGDLVELRVGAAGDQRTLDAIDRRGFAWHVPIAPSDIPALQAALDAIDVKLGPRPAALQPSGIATARLLAIAALLPLAVSGEAGVVLVPILFVLFRPTLTAAVASAGAIALGRALVAMTSFAWIDPAQQTSVIGALAAGVALIIVATRRARAEERRDPLRRPPREASLLVLLLGCLAVLFLVGTLPSALARVASLVSSPLATSAATTLAGIGAAIATMSRPLRRVAGTLTSVTALTAAVLLAGNGTLYNRTAAFAWTTGRLEPAGAVTIPGTGATNLQASPDGSSYAVAQFRPSRRGLPSTRYIIGRIANGAPAPRESDAIQLAFLDDSTVLALALGSADSLQLRFESVGIGTSGGARVFWRRTLPSVELPRLVLDRGRRLWTVLGPAEDNGDVVVMTGTLDGGSAHTYRWRASGPADVGETTAQPLAAFADGSALQSVLAGLRDAGSSVGPMLMLMTAQPRWELRSTGPKGEHVLADLGGVVNCGTEVEAESTVCVESLGNRTRLWRVSTSEATPVGDLPHALGAVHPLGSRQVAAVERFGSKLVVVDLTAHRGVRVTLPEDPAHTEARRWTTDVVAIGDYVLVLSSGRTGASIQRYRVVGRR